MNKYILYIVGGLVVLLFLIVGIKYKVRGETTAGDKIDPKDISVRAE